MLHVSRIQGTAPPRRVRAGTMCLGEGPGPSDKVVEIRGLFCYTPKFQKVTTHFSLGRISVLLRKGVRGRAARGNFLCDVKWQGIFWVELSYK